jgi:hypothetical protein
MSDKCKAIAFAKQSAGTEDRCKSIRLIRNAQGRLIGIEEQRYDARLKRVSLIDSTTDQKLLALLTQKLTRDVDFAKRLTLRKRK